MGERQGAHPLQRKRKVTVCLLPKAWERLQAECRVHERPPDIVDQIIDTVANDPTLLMQVIKRARSRS